MNSEVAKLANDARGNLKEVASLTEAGNTEEAIQILSHSVDMLADAVDKLNK
jgi:hypothetical protein